MSSNDCLFEPNSVFASSNSWIMAGTILDEYIIELISIISSLYFFWFSSLYLRIIHEAPINATMKPNRTGHTVQNDSIKKYATPN